MAQSRNNRPGNGSSRARGVSPQAQSARERLAAERAAAEASARTRRTIGIAAAVAAVLLGIIGVMFLVNQNKPAATPTASTSGNYLATLTSVPAANLDAVGAGSTTQVNATAVPNGKVATKDGKPRYLYVGTEFCPYCAMERWPLTIALSRFGTFTGLETDVTPANEGSVPTVTYKNAKYSSQYLTFDGYETADAEGKPLQTLPADDTAIMKQYDPKSSVPFSYWGTQFQVGASYAGNFLSQADPNAVAAKLADTNSAEAKAILGAANLKTAQICKITNNQPANVCSAAGVQAAAKVLG